jgi:hypothetical protein
VVRLLCRPVMSKSIQDTVILPQNVVLTYRNTSKLSSHCVCWLSTNALDKSCSLTLCFKWYKYFLIKFLIWMCWSYSRKPFLSMWEWIFSSLKYIRWYIETFLLNWIVNTQVIKARFSIKKYWSHLLIFSLLMPFHSVRILSPTNVIYFCSY